MGAMVDTMVMVQDIATMVSVRLMLSQRLMLNPTCMDMEDMDWDTLAILLDSMDIISDILTTMASVKLSPRLTPTFFMEDMDTLDMLDTTDTPMLTMDLLTMEGALLMLSPRLTPTFCMEDMDTLDTPDTMDTLIAPIATTVKLFPLVLWTANHPCFLYQ